MCLQLSTYLARHVGNSKVVPHHPESESLHSDGYLLYLLGRSRCGTVDQSGSQRDLHMPM